MTAVVCFSPLGNNNNWIIGNYYFFIGIFIATLSLVAIAETFFLEVRTCPAALHHQSRTLTTLPKLSTLRRVATARESLLNVLIFYVSGLSH